MALAPFLASLADALEADPAAAAEAARIARALGLATAPAAPEETIPLTKVPEHGAPSAEWVRDRARKGLIEILGPRRARFVRASDLQSLLAASTIARRPQPAVSDAATTRAAVVDLAARRKRHTG